jgi:gamma-polyglutamate biosynthesis protein CapA
MFNFFKKIKGVSYLKWLAVGTVTLLLCAIAGILIISKAEVVWQRVSNKPGGPNLPQILNKEKEELNFLFFGDLMLDRNVKVAMGEEGVDKLLSGFAGERKNLFEEADLVGANLEGAVTNKGEHYLPGVPYDFAFSPEIIGQLKKYNFNFFNLANNHILDQGAKGLAETKSNLEKLGFNYAGCPDKEIGECSYQILEFKGHKIALAGWSMVYGLFDREKAKVIVQEAKKQSDFLAVNIHWGVEYEHYNNDLQRDIARELIDSGADVIIGHHPHVVEGMEIYKEKPIFYSLGNFIFDQYFSADTQEGLAVKINYNFKDKTIGYQLFPFKSEKSILRWMDDEEEKEFLGKMGRWGIK